MSIITMLFRLLESVPRSWIDYIATLRGRYPLLKRNTEWITNSLRNRVCVIQKGLGRGLKFNSGNSAVGFVLGTHDMDVQFAMSELIEPGFICFDLGANVGFTAVLMARCVGELGRVLCFEPLVENALQIRVNADLNGYDRIIVHQVALGDADGQALFQVSNSPTWGRLTESGFTPDQSGVVSVPVRHLDAMIESEKLPLPNFIKMDVEGAEGNVLIGCRKMLAKARPVMIIELHHTYDAVLEALAGLDFVVRPLVAGGDGTKLDGEYQILVYPTGHKKAEVFWENFVNGSEASFASRNVAGLTAP